jgi:hypothetical protein
MREVRASWQKWLFVTIQAKFTRAEQGYLVAATKLLNRPVDD